MKKLRTCIVVTGLFGCGEAHREPPLPREVPLEDVIQLSAGTAHVCALLRSGRVKCWGRNDSGELGEDNEQPRDYAVWTPGVFDAVEVRSGGTGSCAVTGRGALWCWGRGDRSPREIELDAEVEHVAVGRDHTCALLGNGEVVCWGDDCHGQAGFQHVTTCSRGDACVEEPGQVIEADATDLVAGRDHSCALQAGQVMCWGLASVTLTELRDNECDGVGSCGDTCSKHPTPIPDLDDALQLASGWRHMCARRASDVVCWGFNDFNATGNPNDLHRSPFSVEVEATDLAASDSLTCALRSDGRIACWGRLAPYTVGARGFTPGEPLEIGADGATGIAVMNDSVCAVQESGRVTCWEADDDTGALAARGITTFVLDD
jgi:alpha-tubulin suppressor-like RCC1 family protein